MAKGKRRKERMKLAKKEAPMDVEGGDGWQSGVSAAAAMDEEAAGPSFLAMDTSDFGTGAARAGAGGGSGTLKAPHTGLKVKVSTKRGARTTKQKRRKEKALERALGFTERLDTKTAAVEPRQLNKKAAKQLWRADD